MSERERFDLALAAERRRHPELPREVAIKVVTARLRLTTPFEACFGLGDLVYHLARPIARIWPSFSGAKNGGCAACQTRRKSWNRFRVCWR